MFTIVLGFFLAVSSRKVQTAYLTESNLLNYIGTCGEAKFSGGNFENKLKQFFISKINPAAKGHSLTGRFWRRRTNGFLPGIEKNTSRWYLHKNKKHHASELDTSDRGSECCCSLPDRSVGQTPNPLCHFRRFFSGTGAGASVTAVFCFVNFLNRQCRYWWLLKIPSPVPVPVSSFWSRVSVKKIQRCQFHFHNLFEPPTLVPR